MIRATWGPGIAVSENDRVIPGATGRAWRPNPAYKMFKEGMAWASLPFIKGVQFRGRMSVTLRVDLPPRMDTMACIKAACDAVELAGAIENDGQIDRLTVERVGRSPRGQSVIDFEIEEVRR